MYRFSEGDVTHFSCSNKFRPLKCSTNSNHAAKSLLAYLFKVILWFGRDTAFVRSMCLRRKHLPGRTTMQQKLRRSIIYCKECKVILRHFWCMLKRCLTFSSLSTGKRASMFPESSSNPMNVRHVQGPTVLSYLIGTPISLQSAKHFCRSFANFPTQQGLKSKNHLKCAK